MSWQGGIERVATPRLVLERWDPERHTAGLIALNRDPEVMRFIGAGRPAARGDSERASEAIAAHWARYGFGLWVVSAPAHEHAFVGFAGLAHPLWLPAEAAEVEVGWRLRRDAWGQGYATEAARAGVAVAFAALGLARLISCIRPENTRSQAVARRLGMAIARARLAHAVDVWELRADRPRRAGAGVTR